ncbi:hypothetical protein TWF788_003539 [Orbilia oligospora]|uniref:Uncharacterized protein n=1 Tax=Orbilia oligospora TaxID=2813651 RepID=A0A7C8U1U3_ORBOL|nr:hypothetical protein TWF788_003539 [Orbilia oligospora]
MVIPRDAPFAVRYIRVFSAIALLLSVASTVLLSMIAVYAWLGSSQLRIPFVIAGVFNIISTTLILIFSLWQFSVLVTVLSGGFPCFVIAVATGGLWSVSVLQFKWLPDMVVVRDTRWILMAAIAVWVLKLALEVIFWTLLIALRYRRSTLQKEDAILERHIDNLEIMETNDDRPESSRSITKPGEPRVPRQTVLIAHAQKNWSRPFTRSARVSTFSRNSPIPPERPPRSPPRSYPHNLEPSPFAHSSTSLPGNTSPFLNLINRPKSRAPASPAPIASPLSIAEREASKMTGFDEWDTSELPMQDRIAYSIAAAEATSPDPGAPPHARGSPTGITTRSHRSSSMPTPPRTPPQPRPRTNSMGSNSGAPAAAQRQSQTILAPTPTLAPLTSTPTVSLRPFPISIPSQIKGMGINIPLCDSPDREHHSVRLATSPLQKAHSLREVESHSRDNSSSTHSSSSDSRKNSMDNNPPSEESEERTTAWQARWAATLERKVTPPMPGFEISPVESMRRMRVEREAQRSRQQQHAQTTNRAQPAPNSNLLGATSWIAEASSTNSSEAGTESGMRSRRSYVAPTTPNTGEFPRNVIAEMIDEIQDGLINRRS